jgi:hypothetical protein
MDHRQRSLVAAAIRTDLGRVQNRLGDGDSYAIVEIAEFLREIVDDDLPIEVIQRLVSSLPAAQAGAVIAAHPSWPLLAEAQSR